MAISSGVTAPISRPTGPWSRASDPSVAYDPKHHTWMISSLVFNTFAPFNNGVVTSLSTDGGLSWSKPVIVVQSTKLGFDKNWITCDTTASSRFYGHCYTEWDTFVNKKFFNLISMSTSTNGGLTWGVAKHPANSANGIGLSRDAAGFIFIRQEDVDQAQQFVERIAPPVVGIVVGIKRSRQTGLLHLAKQRRNVLSKTPMQEQR